MYLRFHVLEMIVINIPMTRKNGYVNKFRDINTGNKLNLKILIQYCL
jgi:hypothetical protein